MEAVVNWFQDWSDACRYANECAPDMSFLPHLEPWSAFAAIGLIVFAVWLRNEKDLKKTLEKERRAAATAQPANFASVLEQMKGSRPSIASQQHAA